MDSTCLVYGFVISLVVSVLKRWPFAANNPKIIAAVLSSAIGLWQAFAHGGAAVTAATIGTLVQCVVAQLATAVGTHEIVVQPVTDALSGALLNIKK